MLGDDSFATLMNGLREGRRIVENVQKGLVFLVSTHVALLGFILIATLAGYGQPLLPIQILWLELFIDVSTSVAFEREPEEPGAMERPPRPRDEPLLSRGLLAPDRAGRRLHRRCRAGRHRAARRRSRSRPVAAYTALAVGQVVRANANRSLSTSVLRLPRNAFLAGAALLVIAIQALIPFVPPLADAFRASPLDAVEWGLVALIALAPAVVADLVRRTGRAWVA